MTRRLEDSLQKTCVHWLALTRPDVFYFSIPNEAKRKPRTGARLKSMGMRAGVADLCVMVGDADPFVAFIEFKAGKGKQTPAQKEFQRGCNDRGIPYAICRSLDEFIGIINAWAGRK